MSDKMWVDRPAESVPSHPQYVARIECRSIIEVEFESDTSSWPQLQQDAFAAAFDSGLVPDGWQSLGYPLIEPIRRGEVTRKEYFEDRVQF